MGVELVCFDATATPRQGEICPANYTLPQHTNQRETKQSKAKQDNQIESPVAAHGRSKMCAQRVMHGSESALRQIGHSSSAPPSAPPPVSVASSLASSAGSGGPDAAAWRAAAVARSWSSASGQSARLSQT